MEIRCIGCNKEAFVLFKGNSYCPEHYAKQLTEIQYFNLMNKRAKAYKVSQNQELPLPVKEEIYKQYIAFLKEMYGDKFGTKNSV